MYTDSKRVDEANLLTLLMYVCTVYVVQNNGGTHDMHVIT